MNNQLTLNGAMRLDYPDGFRLMDQEERSRQNFLKDGPGECLPDPQRHMLVSVGWKSAGFFISKLAGTKESAENMEARIRKGMQGFGYRAVGFLSREAGIEPAEGFGYEYEAQGVDMYAESYVVKHGKTFYYLHFYTRKELKGENLEIWKTMFSSIKWL